MKSKYRESTQEKISKIEKEITILRKKTILMRIFLSGLFLCISGLSTYYRPEYGTPIIAYTLAISYITILFWSRIDYGY